MILGRITGTVVATRKDEKLAGKKLLVVRTLDPETGKEEGYTVAVDTVGAGVGETVICVSGSSARLATGMKDHPVDTAIVGIVDRIKVEKS
ncbi:MAG TPA: EutN/CcmL family microcompartment protein [Acidobacteriota bacterium]|jgi:microcompartment protein CcmK/EutM